MEGESPNKNKKIKKQNVAPNKMIWPLKILLLAFALSVLFSVLSEYVLKASSNYVVQLIISVIIIIVFIIIAIISDMIGVAVTACDVEPFMAMASKKVKGSKEALMLIKNNDKVASLMNDVIGDVCGILSGAAGATIVAIILISYSGSALSIICSALISGIIAGFTIFGKAIGKTYAINNCCSIILKVGKFLSIFSKRSKKDKNK